MRVPTLWFQCGVHHLGAVPQMHVRVVFHPKISLEPKDDASVGEAGARPVLNRNLTMFGTELFSIEPRRYRIPNLELVLALSSLSGEH